MKDSYVRYYKVIFLFYVRYYSEIFLFYIKIIIEAFIVRNKTRLEGNMICMIYLVREKNTRIEYNLSKRYLG